MDVILYEKDGKYVKKSTSLLISKVQIVWFDTQVLTAINVELSNCRSTVKFKFNLHDVKSVFKKANLNNSPGPDGTTGRVLNNCAEQLSCVFFDIFSMCLGQRRVPKLWKESIVVPWATCGSSKQLSNLSPVVLTSLAMKSFEKRIF